MEYRTDICVDGALNRSRVKLHQYIAAGAACLALLGVAAASVGSVSGEGQEYANTRMEVETRQGDVQCYGNRTVRVAPGDTATEIILSHTALVPDSVTSAKPDPEPVAVAVLALNGINDPGQLPSPFALRHVPDHCAFQPVH